MTVYSIEKLMSEARRLAAEYRRATGKTLAVSGEIAVFDAIRLLGLEPAPPGAGWDASRHHGDCETRILVKGRAIFDEARGGHRLGNLKLNEPWDAVVLVLMDEQYEPVELWEASRERLAVAIAESEGTSRSKRGPLSVARFRHLGRLVWSQRGVLGQESGWSPEHGLGITG